MLYPARRAASTGKCRPGVLGACDNTRTGWRLSPRLEERFRSRISLRRPLQQMQRLSTDDRNRLAKFHQRLQLLSFLRGQGSIVIAIHQILQPLVGPRRPMKTGDCFDQLQSVLRSQRTSIHLLPAGTGSREQRFDERVGVEGLQIVEGFADADEADEQLAGYLGHVRIVSIHRLLIGYIRCRAVMIGSAGAGGKSRSGKTSGGSAMVGQAGIPLRAAGSGRTITLCVWALRRA